MATKKKSKKRKNKKHFVLYNNNGVISATTPKDWARGHRTDFPDHTFADAPNTPTDIQIENHLNHLGFRQIKNSQLIISYHYLDL